MDKSIISVIGLTGGIASGKSTATQYLLRKGLTVLDCDIIAREITESEEVIAILKANFGPDIINPDKSLNRSALGSIVFGNKSKRELLNALIHPRVEAKVKSLISDFESNKQGRIIFIDVPLLIEGKLFDRIFMNEIWLVSVNLKTQLKRLMDRNNLTEDEAYARINAQMALEEKKKYADVIIDNSLDIKHLERQLQGHLERLTA